MGAIESDRRAGQNAGAGNGDSGVNGPPAACGVCRVRNAFTIDVEDYYHVSAFARSVRKSDWCAYESRVERNTQRVLDVLDEYRTRGTFFVLGWVAEQHPQLVREIKERGHEVGCHGFSHDLVYNQSPEVFRSETVRAKGFLEDTIGEQVLGYRAASYSITRRSLWALEIIAEAGFAFDSSIFPINHDRYGIASAPRLPFRLELDSGRSLWEFPLTTFRFSGMRLPVAGGGYFRLLPLAYTCAGMSRVNRHDRAPAVFYLHPWEIDTEQPRLRGSLLSRFRHYTNIDRCEQRLRELLGSFTWAPMGEVLSSVSLSTVSIKALA